MARKPRQYAEWHHVMNRGRNHGTVFRTSGDAAMFLEILGESLVDDVEIHAFALMNNHYHLLARGQVESVSAVMKRVGGRFTQAINRRHGTDGSLFRGRVHIVPVFTPLHLDIVGWYIHRNPLARRPQPSLESYRWSSLRAYVGLHPGPSWLRTDHLVAVPRRSARQYLDFIHCDRVDAQGDSAIVDWAIQAALLEVDRPLREQRRVRETVRALLSDPPVGEWSAAHQARYRAERRAAEAPWILDVSQRVRDLLGVRSFPLHATETVLPPTGL